LLARLCGTLVCDPTLFQLSAKPLLGVAQEQFGSVVA
jgi:hypothetical protein